MARWAVLFAIVSPLSPITRFLKKNRHSEAYQNIVYTLKTSWSTGAIVGSIQTNYSGLPCGHVQTSPFEFFREFGWHTLDARWLSPFPFFLSTSIYHLVTRVFLLLPVRTVLATGRPKGLWSWFLKPEVVSLAHFSPSHLSWSHVSLCREDEHHDAYDAYDA